MRPLVLVVAALLVAIAAAFASRGAAPSPTAEAAIATPVPFVTADPSVTSRTDASLAHGRLDPADAVDRRRVVVRGLALPVDGVGLPDDPELLPNAARDYRAGWHEGIDFPARPGTPVHAVAAGIVVRVDRDYVDWSAADEEAALADAGARGYTPAATLDRLRGRQVWIDHGNGIVSRYCHLSAVAEIAVGDVVKAGDVVGAVGSSGYPEGGPHLHLEIRIGTSYLGDGLTGDALVTAIRAAFD